MESTPRLSNLKWGAEILLPNSRPLAKSPHFVGGRYPCRSVAYVPRMLLAEVASTMEDFGVLDPFMGSGTTAIEAARFSKSVYGVEVDPYARLIASTSTAKYAAYELEELSELLKIIIEAAPKQRPKEELTPQLSNIEYWFSEENFENLLRLKSAIHENTEDGKFRDLLMTAFGDIIRACSKAERQSLKPYISTRYTKTPKPVFEEFTKIAAKYVEAVAGNQLNKSDGIIWSGTDATRFTLQSNVDLAITSPPYINAMDYTRCIKLESAWIGTANNETIKFVRERQLGESIRRHYPVDDVAIIDVSKRHFGALENIDAVRFSTAVAFFDDMKRNLQSVLSSLKPSGTYYIIIGNSRIRGVNIPTHQVLAEIAEELGYVWDKYFLYRIRDHRTSIPRGNRGGKIEHEHVLGLRKP